jgi:aldehyde:ferredoxin oxidoreductase
LQAPLGGCLQSRIGTYDPHADKFINPASQTLYADFYNAVLGTSMTWEEIFTQTDRDINLQRVMNALVYGAGTGAADWIPDRAIGPTDDGLYEAEQAYSDGDLERLTGKTPEEIQAMTTTEKRETLLALRKEELRKLIRIYYDQRGWSEQGVPTVETLQSLGLWTFLTEEARTRIAALQ